LQRLIGSRFDPLREPGVHRSQQDNLASGRRSGAFSRVAGTVCDQPVAVVVTTQEARDYVVNCRLASKTDLGIKAKWFAAKRASATLRFGYTVEHG
jgi:hypothetical protein